MRVTVDKIYGSLFLLSTKEDDTTTEEAEQVGGTVENTYVLNNNKPVRGEFVAVEKITTYRTYCVIRR